MIIPVFSEQYCDGSAESYISDSTKSLIFPNKMSDLSIMSFRGYVKCATSNGTEDSALFSKESLTSPGIIGVCVSHAFMGHS